jgi:hypothetical protein
MSEPYHLHLVLGGELTAVGGVQFRDPSAIEFVGAFSDYNQAYAAWKARAQATVDNAHARYFILDAAKLLDPDGDGRPG